MVRAAGPERRTMPMPPRPGGVEMATMVSLSRMAIAFNQGIAVGIFGVVGGAVLEGFGCFAGGFLWTGCGGMRGKDGQRFA